MRVVAAGCVGAILRSLIGPLRLAPQAQRQERHRVDARARPFKPIARSTIENSQNNLWVVKMMAVA
jgi:hypothetical protein